MFRRIRNYFNDINKVKGAMLIIIILSLLVLIFHRFIPFIKVDDIYYNGFNKSYLLYNLDIIFISATLIFFIISLIEKNKILNLITFILSIISFLIYLISYLLIFNYLIKGFFLLFIALYLITIILIYTFLYN